MQLKTQAVAAFNLLQKAGVTDDEIYSVEVMRTASIHVSGHLASTALIKLFHHYKVPRANVTAKKHEKYVFIDLILKGCKFTALVSFEEATQFIDVKQKAIASRTKGIGLSTARFIEYNG